MIALTRTQMIASLRAEITDLQNQSAVAATKYEAIAGLVNRLQPVIPTILSATDQQDLEKVKYVAFLAQSKVIDTNMELCKKMFELYELQDVAAPLWIQDFMHTMFN